MEKSQYNLCVEVLKRLDKSGVLKDVILIGSWCMPFYKSYFGNIEYRAAIKTRDVDFLVPHPSKIKTNTDIPELLKDLGFIVDFKGSEGYIRLEHPSLMIEFLVPERGRGSGKPYRLPQFGLNAQALRFLDLLTSATIKAKIEGVEVDLPHPINFGLHKLIIFPRRADEEKRAKDRNAGREIIKALIAKGEAKNIRRIFDSLIPKWRKKVIKGLEETKEKDILDILINQGSGY